MHLKRLLIPGLALSAGLVITAFGTDGLTSLLTTRIHPADAAAPAAATPAPMILTTSLAGPISTTVSVFHFVPSPDLPNRPPDAGGVFSGREGNTLTLQSSFFQVINGTAATAVSGAAGGGPALSGPFQAGVTIVAGSAPVSGTIANVTTESQGGVAVLSTGSGPLEFHSVTITGPGDEPVTGAVPPGPGATFSVFPAGAALPAAPQKVVVTPATKIYHDVTPMPQLPAGGDKTASGGQPASGEHLIQQTLAAGSLDSLTDKMIVTVWGHTEVGQLIADVLVYQNQLPN